VQAAKVHFLRKLIFESRPNFGYFQIFFWPPKFGCNSNRCNTATGLETKASWVRTRVCKQFFYSLHKSQTLVEGILLWKILVHITNRKSYCIRKWTHELPYVTSSMWPLPCMKKMSAMYVGICNPRSCSRC
jgi:hypothetical protein